MKTVRQLHLYLGTLFAPLIIFFALTGILQTLELHEGAGTPTWIEQLASIHKKQALQAGEPPRRRSPAPGGEGDADAVRPAAETARGPSPWPLKWFVVAMSLGLTVTTGLGVYMAFKIQRKRALVWALLAVGTILPVVLLWI